MTLINNFNFMKYDLHVKKMTERGLAKEVCVCSCNKCLSEEKLW